MHCLTSGLLSSLLSLGLLLLGSERASALVSIPLVEVGSPQDCTSFEPPFGCVERTFQIARFEITNAQYAEFLNAMAAEGDPFALFPGEKNLIQVERSGGGTELDPFVYTVRNFEGLDIPSWPMNWIDWYRAARFVNWLENGQPTADEMPDATEVGTYDMNQTLPSRNPDASWVLPTLDEWFKAGYHDPLDPDAGSVDFADFWSFPVQAHGLTCEPPPGGSISANCNTVDPLMNPVPVGSYGEAASHYGTYDQAGNVREWVEDVVDLSFDPRFSLGSYALGGAFDTSLDQVDQMIGFPVERNVQIGDAGGAGRNRGFRVAFVPEPPAALLRAAALAAVAVPAALARRRRRAARRA